MHVDLQSCLTHKPKGGGGGSGGPAAVAAQSSTRRASFGQLVIGPPGAGKTTYCLGMQQFLTALGRKVAIINLDFASEQLDDQAAVDIRDLVDLETVMTEMDLGPNGATLYCMEYLEANLDWLDEKLAALKGHYLLFDFPVQVAGRWSLVAGR